MLLYECPEVFDKLDFAGVTKVIFELINNKSKIHAYCESIGLNMPKTYNYDDIIDNKEIEFPLIFKLNTKKINPDNNPIGKVRIVNNDIELQHLLSEISTSSISNEDIIIQAYVAGDNSHQFSFGGYFKDGVELAGIVVNQLRQYPQGISSFVVETSNKDIEKTIIKSVMSFVESLKYTGFLEMEFKIGNNQIFLMDINPRPWGWVSILEEKYKNFYKLFSGDDNIKLIKSNQIVMWKSPIRDIIGKIKNPLNSKKKIKVSKRYLAYDIYDKSDLMPSLAIFKVGIDKLVKKFR